MLEISYCQLHQWKLQNAKSSFIAVQVYSKKQIHNKP